ncbi:hypothetical protein BKM09_004595 [Pseudomonas amygdali pv. morsprunorum]|nr:hypothetical protein BKM19_022075 [Pseudomonas amygdali pv. morsprunorum]POP94450.1 hypothetical protein CXB39_10520 [Pseudomonas amygdali pv. morsprunorum]POY78275.1 hypothetical protein BKM09_004595 [Pseudomonas amygdali pv. morsprunorum]TSC39002.1 hypothetical protein FOM00_01040 [Pseudomonas sp. ST1]
MRCSAQRLNHSRLLAHCTIVRRSASHAVLDAPRPRYGAERRKSIRSPLPAQCLELLDHGGG